MQPPQPRPEPQSIILPFEGGAPRECANTEKFYGKSLETLIVGEPTKFDVVAELGPLLKQ